MSESEYFCLKDVFIKQWVYRYSGEMRDIGSHIDKGASVVWEYVSSRF